MPRSSHARWVPLADRPDPVTVLEEQAKTRVPDLVPIRYGRMAVSPFAYFRGAAAPMAWDLAHTPTTDIRVQACGDAHLLNFGMYAAPDRRLVFDVNDFAETLPAPFDCGRESADRRRRRSRAGTWLQRPRRPHRRTRDRAQLSHKGGRICRDALPRCLVLQDRHRRGGRVFDALQPKAAAAPPGKAWRGVAQARAFKTCASHGPLADFSRAWVAIAFRVEVAGIEPASFAVRSGLLRVQPAVAFLSPGSLAG